MSTLNLKVEFPDKLDFLFRPARYKVLHGGRGGSKSWGIARALLIQGFHAPLRILCTREYQNSIKDSVHKLLEDQVSALGMQDFYEVQAKAIIGSNGTEFAFEGLKQNINSLKSFEGADRVWVEEAHTVSRKSWDVLVPTVRKEGSEIWVSFNPEFEDDETYLRFITHPPKSAVVREVNWRDNPWFTSVLEEERLEMLARDVDRYEHIWGGKTLKWLEGAIYANELRAAYAGGRVGDVPWEPMLPVFTAWDLGHTDDTAIWWYQVVHGEVRVLESYASNGGSLSEYATQILGRETQIDLIGNEVVATIGNPVPGLEHRIAYEYQRHWLPHDARAKTLAAKGKSIIQQLAAALPISQLGIVPDIGVEDGIQAARTMFPRTWFNKSGCEDGLRALRRYQRKLAEDEKSFGKAPLHNWTSHYADAYRMMAVAWRSESPQTIPESGRTVQTMTMDDWWDAQDSAAAMERRI